MTLAVGITNTNDGMTVAMSRLYTGEHAESDESKALCEKVCSLLEPAIYEAVRDYVRRGGTTKAIVKWDGQTLKIK